MFEHPRTAPDVADRCIHHSPQRPAGAIASAAAPQAPARPRWASEHLLGGHPEVEIEHQGVVYRLRRTALGKLIMTK